MHTIKWTVPCYTPGRPRGAQKRRSRKPLSFFPFRHLREYSKRKIKLLLTVQIFFFFFCHLSQKSLTFPSCTFSVKLKK
ncbi:hypothetical protein XELAEV_18016676mg [Xenopus laevis]|uniref:Uncharacterized protein n=1 Tax=Xenopus laevis TaxID=8355 RepID=A0A974DCF0_XENLA|nr:hypothetical protein XELAEV_18016676mg [Xenopus laevis]